MDNMYKEIAIDLAKKLSGPSADNGNEFTDDTRLKAIAEELAGSAYSLIVDDSLFKLYAKKPLDKLPKDLLVISSHADCLQFHPVFSQTADKLHGIFDNAITNAAAVFNMKYTDMPDNVVFAFTGDEEDECRGAKRVHKCLTAAGKKYKAIVLDVTEAGWYDSFSVENCFIHKKSQEWGSRLVKCVDAEGTTWVYVSGEPDEPEKYLDAEFYVGNARYGRASIDGNKFEEAGEDEAWTYDEYKVDCFSFCLPIYEENRHMHSPRGIDAKKTSYYEYIGMLGKLANALA